MKNTLRYLLIAFAAMMISVQMAKAHAQSLAQEPQVGFQSTSSMAGSGSTLPQAVQRGTHITCDEDYGIAKDRVVRRDDEFEDDPFTPGPDTPYETPIGDVLWPLALCALAYLIMRVARKRALTS